MVEAYARAKQGEAEATHLLAENARLLVESNKLGEQNFKLRDTVGQLGRQLEQEQGKRKEVEAEFRGRWRNWGRQRRMFGSTKRICLRPTTTGLTRHPGSSSYR